MAERRATIWDLPIRLFHWGLVLCLAGSWYTAENDMLDQHVLFGYAALTLLLFRLVWGLVGSDTARFRSFVRGPAEAVAHLRALLRPGPLDAHAGHNPLGGYAVLGLLGLLAVQVGTGLFISGGDIFLVSGPLNGFVSSTLADRLATVHEISFALLQVLVVVHVLAIALYALVKRRNLVRPMLTGTGEIGADDSLPRIVSPVWALLIAALAAGSVWALSLLA